MTMVGQGAEEVVEELFVFKGLEKVGLERMWMKTSRKLLVAHVAQEFGREPRCPETFISSAASMWI